jgi:hypothetical protein
VLEETVDKKWLFEARLCGNWGRKDRILMRQQQKGTIQSTPLFAVCKKISRVSQ